ncbi:DnaB-like helicase N terminal domain-containing protein [Sanguibacter gelidistatuariae]|uniref:DnaB-like helicase N terminal domain-containing protein n=1 Tax=Sanguibacter gelidistatuariae TaxID=1814289 RepID=A0A1G6SZX0_9MICO|nr:DnaB-like helicase N-terminal domain-containing protein [Sanguibacter gelidistatuariae]SDD22422.1 DnaB-like helicase N terminal domain-containing protein [Sanguibacter gelidistatuariae]
MQFQDDIIAYTERAALGALMLDGDQLAQVSRWLRATDFADPWHGEVFKTLLELHRAGGTTDPQALGAALAERIRPRLADLPRIHEVLAATPERPDTLTYTRHVAETGMRREVGLQGVLLEAGALGAAQAGESRTMTGTCDLVDAALDTVQERWDRSRGRTPTAGLGPVRLRAMAQDPARFLRADRQVTAGPRRDVGVERVNERRLMASLMLHPSAIGGVAEWLTPANLTDLACRAQFTAMLDLTRTCTGVDPVTVMWETQKLVHVAQEPVDLAAVRAAVEEVRLHGEAPERLAANVAGDQLRRIAENATFHIRTQAGNSMLDVGEAIGVGRAFTTTLRRVATALPHERLDTGDRHLALVPTPALDNAAGQASAAVMSR